ncbi:VTC domain-containing protein [Kalaharituber pfeilii]|nr:VTC domain-containing protein [Kalaharituber pfeilii]
MALSRSIRARRQARAATAAAAAPRTSSSNVDGLSYEDNLDYNEICDLIKKHTIGKIPVPNPNQKSDFDDELFEVLLEQLERIELFVKSKAGEIDRRIEHCTRVVTTLCQKDTGIPTSSKRIARYVKAETELERTGYDIQCLSRFSKVQYTGFKKLLKKYKKWTGSSCVADRFLPVLESPNVFHNMDFERNVLVLSDLLAIVRSKFSEPMETLNTGYQLPGTSTRDATGGSVSNLLTSGSEVKTHADLDMVLGTNSPSDPYFASGKGGKAVYWVHNDHLVEIQVLLLKHLNIQSSTPSPTLPSSPALSRRPSATGLSSLTWAPDKVEDVGTVLLDNLPKFAQAQSSKTIEQASETAPAAKIRWCGNSRDAETSVVVASSVHEPKHVPDANTDAEYHNLRLKRKHIESLINANAPLTLKDHQLESAERIKDWFREHPDIVPLVKILARRTRFVSGQKVWAILDRDIRMYRIGENWEGCISNPDREETGKSSIFPHAVLEVRWEGQEEPALVKQLNRSHLVENVYGFSLDVHAVAVMHEPKEMAPPFWLPALSKDIRKTPSRPLRHSRQASTTTIPRISSGPSVSSTVAVEQTDASMESSKTLFTPTYEMNGFFTPTSTKRSLSWDKQTKIPRSIESSWLGGERYWSEFNDENEDEPYTILIQPQSPETRASVGPFGKITQSLKRLFGFDDNLEDETADQRRPLMNDLANDSSDEDIETPRSQTWASSYSTFQSQEDESRERQLLRSYCFCFAASILIVLISGSWAFTHSPKKHEGPSFSTVLVETIAVFCAAVLAGYAVTLFVARKVRVNLLHNAMEPGYGEYKRVGTEISGGSKKSKGIDKWRNSRQRKRRSTDKEGFPSMCKALAVTIRKSQTD